MACDRGSGRVPGKRIQQRHSGEELEMAGWFWRQGTARQSDSGTRGSETNNKVAEEKRRRCRCAFTLGCGHCYSCQGWVGSGPRVVSSAQRRLRLPVMQCRGSATAPEGRDAGCPPPTPHQRPFGASRPESSPSPFPIRAPTGVREKHFGQSSVVFFDCQLPHSIRMPNLAWKRCDGSWDATRAQGSWTLRINVLWTTCALSIGSQRVGFPSSSNAGVALNASIAAT